MVHCINIVIFLISIFYQVRPTFCTAYARLLPFVITTTLTEQVFNVFPSSSGLSVRVLEVKNVEDETFPSIIAQEQWKASEDTITIPKAALLGML